MALLLVSTATVAQGQPCCGDCDGDRRVRVSEVVTAVGITLGSLTPAVCPAATATIDGLVCAVRSALFGCPIAATSTLTSTATVTPTPTPPTATVTATPVEPMSPTPTSTPLGPDLIVDSIRAVHLSGSSCGPFEALSICVANRGDTASGTFAVDLSGIGELAVERFTVASLEALELRCLTRSITRRAGAAFTAVADPDDTIAEIDESNNTRAESVHWPTIRATCTATITRTPTPPAGELRQVTSTPGPDTVWMSLIPCRQCERCDLSLKERERLLDNQDIATSGLVPDGVEVLEHYVRSVGVACAACGCPQSGSPLLGVLVPSEAITVMRDAGWDAHR